MARPKRWKSCMSENLLTLLTVAGVLAGIALGFILRASKSTPWTQREIMYVNFAGDIFLRMLKALILPLIVGSIIAAIGSLDLSLSGTSLEILIKINQPIELLLMNHKSFISCHSLGDFKYLCNVFFNR